MQVLILYYGSIHNVFGGYDWYYCQTPIKIANGIMRNPKIYGFHIIGSNQLFMRDTKDHWHEVTDWSNKMI